MKKMFHLLFAVSIMVSVKAQIQTKMEKENVAQGQIIKKGKMIYTEILIQASPEKVWSVFSDFNNYPNWNPFVKSLKGNLTIGEKLEVFLQPPNSKGMLFKPVLLNNTPFDEFRWIGKLFLPRIFDGEHTFKLIDNHDGTTTFIQFEHFRGILVPLMKQMLDTDTKNGFKLMNEALKVRCEESK